MPSLGRGGWSRPSHAASSAEHVHPWALPVDILPLCPTLTVGGGHVHLSAESGHFVQEFKGLLRTLWGSCLLKVVGGFQ